MVVWLLEVGLGSMGKFEREINRQVIDVPAQKIDDQRGVALIIKDGIKFLQSIWVQ